MVQLRVGMQFPSRENPGQSVKLVERLPSEHWDNRRDPEWVVDLFAIDKKVDTKVFAESQVATEYVTEKQ